MSDHSHDVAVVSLHERGFWQADLFCGAAAWDQHDWDDGNPPDAYFTLALGQSMEDAFARVRAKWPGAKVVEGCQVDEDEIY